MTAEKASGACGLPRLLGKDPEDLPEPENAEDKLAKQILSGLGYCGHYLHFHGGGTSGKAPIICLIAKHGGKISQQELGLHFALKPGSLSEILSKCEAIGLIERSRSTEDRRQLIVELTEEGARQAELEQAARIKFRSEAFSALTLEEREQLLIMLNKIRNTWEGFDD
ncbi:MarR family winged helix-turn-helix transcriptional regulator [Collinsella bouchesdurhonensis]|uniref:MarR family winged helix-turn-helix transcriptional regulator n=1 Tax=Collinsella bouchesdurhonensis TaxID=1907654 RepID=UPI0009FAA074|nr:MarR family winged helix-turn-helix transcriptional regulator [Collinsella bouchesdurhonensis]